MSSGQKPAANRMTMMAFKARAVGAKKGWGLLKKKRDALKTRFQAMLKEIIVAKRGLGASLQDCAFSIAKAKWATESDISSAILTRAKIPAVTCSLKADNVAGVQLPVFKCELDETKLQNTDSLGIGCGGQVIQTCRDQHVLTLKLVIKMASLQTSFLTLDEEIKMTSRRVNALEYVVIPRINDIVQWIKGEMDEMEREEFFRVKKVVEKKKARMELEKLKEQALKGQVASGQYAGQVPSALPQKDNDLLF